MKWRAATGLATIVLMLANPVSSGRAGEVPDALAATAEETSHHVTGQRVQPDTLTRLRRATFAGARSPVRAFDVPPHEGHGAGRVVIGPGSDGGGEAHREAHRRHTAPGERGGSSGG